MEIKRNGVIGLFLAGKSQQAIVRELQHLNVNRKFVYRTIKRYNDTGSIKKRYGGGVQRTATSPDMVRKVKQILQRNPCQSATQMAKELNISSRSIQRILKDDLHVKPYKKEELQDLTDDHKKVRLGKVKELKRQHAADESPNRIFSDEKVSTVQTHANKHNEQGLMGGSHESSTHRTITRRQATLSSADLARGGHNARQ